MVQHNTIDHTGLTGVSTVSYASNANQVGGANAGGAATTQSRGDHVHLGVGSISHASNTFQGVVTLTASGSLGITSPSAGTINLSADVNTDGGGGGAGGLTQAYVGYNTVGGSQENIGANAFYMKKVTLANDALITDIEAYIDGNQGSAVVDSLGALLLADNSGAPREILSVGGLTRDTSMLLDDTNDSTANGVARWIGFPIGRWCPAGDYWICVYTLQNRPGFRLYYDGSGSDRTYNSGGAWIADAGYYTVTTGSNKYSIRANTIR